MERPLQCVSPSLPRQVQHTRLTTENQPCSLYDFMNYLIYVTHDAENLQFYLWLRDYTRRFNALPESEKALSPRWDPHSFRTRISVPTLDELVVSPDSSLTDLEYITPCVANFNHSDVAHPIRSAKGHAVASIQAGLDSDIRWKPCEWGKEKKFPMACDHN
jgi:hypothetical protein